MADENNNILEEPFMSETDIKMLSVSSLSNRPNDRAGQYGKKGMTPEELKAAFSALPVAIAGRLNALVPAILNRFKNGESTSVGTVKPGDDGKSIDFVSVDGTKILGTVDIVALLSDCWTDDIDGSAEGGTPPTATAVKDYVNGFMEYVDAELKKRVVKLTPTTSGKHVYAINADLGKTELLQVHEGGEGNTIVSRDREGYFHVTKEPQKPSHPISKQYFDRAENHPLSGGVNELRKQLENLEVAATGGLYCTVEKEAVASAVQLGDALPYGIISRLGGCRISYPNGRMDTLTVAMNGAMVTTENPLIPVDENGNKITFKPVFPLKASLDISGEPEAEPLINVCWLHTNEWETAESRAVLHDGDVLNEKELSSYAGEDMWIELAARDVGGMNYFTVNSVTVKTAPTVSGVQRIVSGLPYALEGAAVYNGNMTDYTQKVQVTENGVIAPKGATYGVFIPCELPSGATITVYADGVTSGNDTLNKFALPDKQEAKLGNPLTLSKPCSMILIQKTDAKTPFTDDMEIRNIRIEIDDPSYGSVMTVLEDIDIPDEITSLAGYGVGLDEECYNYLDLTNKRFVRVCMVVNDNVARLTVPETVDVSEYLSDDFDVLALMPYCLVRLEDGDGKPVSVPYSLSYKKKLKEE